MLRRGLSPWLWLVPLVALGGGYAACWKIVHDRAIAIMDQQVALWRAAGYEVAWSDRATGGFPLKIEATFVAPRVASPPGADSWSWSAERLRVHLRPWSWSRITLAPEGRHRAITQALGVLDGEAEGLRVTLDADALGLRRARLASGYAAIVRSGDGRTLAAAEALALHAERADRNPGDYRLVATAVRPEWSDAREGAPEQLVLDARATDLDVLGARGALDAGALAAWAAAGGMLTVNEARVDWGDSQIGASGALSLDRNGRWNGEIELDTRAPSRAFAHLASIGAVETRAALQAGAIADALETGDDDAVRLPLTLREGEVYALGMVRLGRVAPAF